MSKHTPGPWSWEQDTLYGKDDGYTVEVLEGAYFPEENEREREDRRLIAAAPEMLAALKAVEPFGDLQPAAAMKAGLTNAERMSFDEIIAKVRAAIAKAEALSQRTEEAGGADGVR